MFLLTLLACGTDTPQAPAPAPAKVEAPAPAPPAAPAADPEVVVEQMRGCLHWAGEEPYDDERRKMIADGVKKTCEPATAGLPTVVGSLEGEAAAIAVDFVGYQGAVEGVTVDARLCDASAAHHKAKGDANKADLPYFTMVCPTQAGAL